MAQCIERPNGEVMGIKLAGARAVAAAATWGLKHVFHRPAANFPGKIALYVDPSLIADLAYKVQDFSVAVVGTNGKTTVTSLIADTFEAAGKSVICNRTGANLDSGVATALLHAQPSDVGVFETDELWLAKIAPQLKPRYVLLLNLFRDQLDRVGEIDRIQESIVEALASTPQTTLVFNADDPLCAAIAERVPNSCIAFGVQGNMGLVQNTVADAQMCQRCSTMMEYTYRQYGQLGDYACPQCGFARPSRDIVARNVHLNAKGARFEVAAESKGAAQLARSFSPFELHTSLSGAYMVYNLLAVAAIAQLEGVKSTFLQCAIDAFDPKNGRLQEFHIGECRVLLNLAKNPTGFNQNIKIILQDEHPKTVAFFINDKEADGHDVSWLWDIDFEELAERPGIHAFAGGIRGADMKVRLKYAGIDALVVSSAADIFERTQHYDDGADERVYLIANYTALPALHTELTRMAAVVEEEQGGSISAFRTAVGEAGVSSAVAKDDSALSAADDFAPAPSTGSQSCAPKASAKASNNTEPLVIVHLFPDLLNLYGDGGNVKVLEYRARKRGIPVEVRQVKYGEHAPFDRADLVFMGGGPDREQQLASQALLELQDDLQRFVDEDGALLAICGGYQILGSEWLLGDDVLQGLGILDITTGRTPGGAYNRLIGNIALRSPIAQRAVIGYENHAGRTHLGAKMQPFGQVISSTGHGNNDTSKADGVLYRSVLGTYLHGPLLSKNPEVADWLLTRALAHRAARAGDKEHPQSNKAGFQSREAAMLAPLDDAAEIAANDAVAKRLGIKTNYPLSNPM